MREFATKHSANLDVEPIGCAIKLKAGKLRKRVPTTSFGVFHEALKSAVCSRCMQIENLLTNAEEVVEFGKFHQLSEKNLKDLLENLYCLLRVSAIIEAAAARELGLRRGLRKRRQEASSPRQLRK